MRHRRFFLKPGRGARSTDSIAVLTSDGGPSKGRQRRDDARRVRVRRKIAASTPCYGLSGWTGPGYVFSHGGIRRETYRLGLFFGTAPAGVRVFSTWDHAEVEIDQLRREHDHRPPHDTPPPLGPHDTVGVDVDGQTVNFDVIRDGQAWWAFARVESRTVVLAGHGAGPAGLALTRIGRDHPFLLARM